MDIQILAIERRATEVSHIMHPMPHETARIDDDRSTQIVHAKIKRSKARSHFALKLSRGDNPSGPDELEC